MSARLSRPCDRESVTTGHAVGLSRGNFYYHFNSKDEILDAVIEARLADTHRMLQAWEAEAPTPAGRIMRYVEIVLAHRADIQDFGCPVGTLTTELAKLEHAMFGQAARLRRDSCDAARLNT